MLFDCSYYADRDKLQCMLLALAQQCAEFHKPARAELLRPHVFRMPELLERIRRRLFVYAAARKIVH